MSTLQTTATEDGSKSERAYAYIRERIADHDYPPGHRLVLATIGGDLGMSVVPVREAIRRLEAEGLVTFERNVGARVSIVDEQQYVHTMQTLGLVEGFATGLAAAHLSPADLDRAAAVNAQMEALLDDFDPHVFTDLNHEFHSLLYAPCANPQVLDLVERTWSRLSGLRDTTFARIPDRPQHSVEEHAHILDLIRTGADATDIELAVRRHRLRTLDAFLAARHSHTPHD